MEKLALYGGPKVRSIPFEKPNRYGEEELKELKRAIDLKLKKAKK